MNNWVFALYFLGIPYGIGVHIYRVRSLRRSARHAQELLQQREELAKMEAISEQNRRLAIAERLESSVAIVGDTDEMDDNNNKQPCAICLEPFRTGDSMVSGRRCNHKFHYECLHGWAILHDECPTCRRCLWHTRVRNLVLPATSAPSHQDGSNDEFFEA